MHRTSSIAAALVACMACGGKKETRPAGEQGPTVVTPAPQDAAPAPTPAGAKGGYVEDAAAARWVLVVLPADFAHDTRADVVSLGGPCRDVVARGGRLLALVGAGATSELVTLAYGAKGYVAGARVRLPRAYQRILD